MRRTSSDSFQDLLNQLGAEDIDVRSELLVAAEARLRRLTRRMLCRYSHLRRWEQTDDVFQNAMVKFHRALLAVQPDSSRRFFGLAVTQIRRSLIDLARHHFGAHGQAAHHDTAGSVDQAVRSVSGNGPETAEAWANFHQSVEMLPEPECCVFSLIWYGGLEQSAVADLLDVSVSTVQRRWYRARHHLAQLLGPYESSLE